MEDKKTSEFSVRKETGRDFEAHCRKVHADAVVHSLTIAASFPAKMLSSIKSRISNPRLGNEQRHDIDLNQARES